MRLLLITNQRAGGTDDDAVRGILGVLETAADVEVVDVDDPDRLPDLLDRTAESVPVVIGGDGSVHALVAAAQRLGRLGGTGATSFDFGLIPQGTGNDLARALGLPLDPVAAARVIRDGRRRDLDVLIDDADHVVVNAVHLGVGAEAGRRAAAWKPRLGRLAYPLGAVVAGLSARGWPLRVTVDDAVVADGTRRVLMVALGNGVTIGGGAPVAPQARPDDGRVDVIVSFATSRSARIGFAAALMRRRHPQRADVVNSRGRTVTVDGGPVPVNTDGEVAVVHQARTWTVLHHAARVIVPA